MTEETHRTWDIAFKWLGLIGILGSAWWTVHTYKESRTKEQNSFIFERQASLYLEAARAAATIASSSETDSSHHTDATMLRTARDRFEQLYLGELVVVEDRRVELAMIAFHTCLSSKNGDCNRPSENQYGNPISAETVAHLGGPTLFNLSLELAACTRTALEEDRNIQFGARKSAKSICPYD